MGGYQAGTAGGGGIYVNPEMIVQLGGTLVKRNDELGIDMDYRYVLHMLEKRSVHFYVRGGATDMLFWDTEPFSVAYNAARASG